MQLCKNTALLASLCIFSVHAAPDSLDTVSQEDFAAFVAQTQAGMEKMDQNIAEIKAMLSEVIQHRQPPQYRAGTRVYGRYIEYSVVFQYINGGRFGTNSCDTQLGKVVSLDNQHYLISNGGEMITTGRWAFRAVSRGPAASNRSDDGQYTYHDFFRFCHPIYFEKVG